MIEILVILVIVGLLLGAIFVSLNGIRENAETKSLMKTMGTVVRATGVCNNVNYVSGDPQGSLICLPSEGNPMTLFLIKNYKIKGMTIDGVVRYRLQEVF